MFRFLQHSGIDSPSSKLFIFFSSSYSNHLNPSKPFPISNQSFLRSSLRSIKSKRTRDRLGLCLCICFIIFWFTYHPSTTPNHQNIPSAQKNLIPLTSHHASKFVNHQPVSINSHHWTSFKTKPSKISDHQKSDQPTRTQRIFSILSSKTQIGYQCWDLWLSHQEICDSREFHRALGLAQAQAKLDVIWTWVNGSDPTFELVRQRHVNLLAAQHEIDSNHSTTPPSSPSNLQYDLSSGSTYPQDTSNRDSSSSDKILYPDEVETHLTRSSSQVDTNPTPFIKPSRLFHRAQKRIMISGPKTSSLLGNAARHFRDHDELRYSMRSVMKSLNQSDLIKSLQIFTIDFSSKELHLAGVLDPELQNTSLQSQHWGSLPTWFNLSALDQYQSNLNKNQPKLRLRHHSEARTIGFGSHAPTFSR